ncbi:hypothetical protein GCM10010214_19980 [Streptomyces abikoensis]|nr:hypothetical protein GCM10010214_19980 [Streptomyces abikoensis]
MNVCDSELSGELRNHSTGLPARDLLSTCSHVTKAQGSVGLGDEASVAPVSMPGLLPHESQRVTD